MVHIQTDGEKNRKKTNETVAGFILCPLYTLVSSAFSTTLLGTFVNGVRVTRIILKGKEQESACIKNKDNRRKSFLL